MKVLLLNGSPHEHGCTATALGEMEKVFAAEGIETERVWIGNQPCGGCIACKSCYQTHRCAFGGGVNEFVEKAKTADGFIFGSPVHYAAASGNLTAFLDRAFYSAPSEVFRYKPAAAIVCARRGGTTAAFDQLNKYMTISQMPIVSSSYWNQVHGSAPEEVLEDKEGVRCMRVLAHNMAWLLRCIEAGRAAGVAMPAAEPPARTNFIR